STSSSPICSGGCQPGAWSPEASPSPFPLFILLRLCPLSPTRRDAWSSGRSSAAGSLICSGEVRSVVGKLRSGAPVRLSRRCLRFGSVWWCGGLSPRCRSVCCFEESSSLWRGVQSFSLISACGLVDWSE
ncbi:unnamed protein product, partial [Brassica rapa subsp. narinosa]